MIPPAHACSDSSDASSTEELEITNVTSNNHDSSDESSLISVDSALEALNILESSDDENVYNKTINLPLTPILQHVFPSQNEPNYDAIPSISSIPSLGSVQTDQPIIDTCSTRKRKKAQKKKVISKKVKTSKKFVLSYKWKKELFFHRAECDESTPLMPSDDEQQPLSFFYRFLSPNIIQDIVDQSNLYSVQVKGRSIQLTHEEFLTFLAIQILMGVVHMPSYTDYWNRRLRFTNIADLMPIKRYQTIRRYIHFIDNNLDDDGDRYFKVRPIVEKIRQNCLKMNEEQNFSIDEMMIPYKGTKAGNRRQYTQNKPNVGFQKLCSRWCFRINL